MELLDGGVLRVRGDDMPLGARAFVQGGKLDEAVNGVPVTDSKV